MTSHLLLADHRAGWWRPIPVPPPGAPLPRTLPEPRRATLAEHAGVLRLPSGSGARAVFADDARGALVVLDTAGGVTELPAAIPAEHLAGDTTGTLVACTTGLGASWVPWSDLLTLADLREGTVHRVRLTRVGEPGVAIVDGADGPTVLLRHREPGAVEAVSVASIRAAGAHCPVVSGTSVALAGDHGHGDALDPATGVLHCATEVGVERVALADGTLHRLPTWPWPVDGRAYFLRLDPATRRLVAALRGGPTDPAQWHRWHNHVVSWSLDDGAAHVVRTDDGLVFRPDVLAGDVGWTVVHPDGDRWVRLDRRGRTTSTDLPAMTAAPRPGATPWDPVDGRPAQRRAAALVDEHRAVVTRGGDGELHLVSAGLITSTVGVGTPLDEGGHLALLPGEPARVVDGIGR